jgi:acyl-CoA reductase-like NAD-dependent aldehyde dehydrogenase
MLDGPFQRWQRRAVALANSTEYGLTAAIWTLT